jgi:hypothetical protein
MGKVESESSREMVTVCGLFCCFVIVHLRDQISGCCGNLMGVCLKVFPTSNLQAIIACREKTRLRVCLYWRDEAMCTCFASASSEAGGLNRQDVPRQYSTRRGMGLTTSLITCFGSLTFGRNSKAKSKKGAGLAAPLAKRSDLLAVTRNCS